MATEHTFPNECGPAPGPGINFVGSHLFGAAIGVLTRNLWFQRLFTLYALLFRVYLSITTLVPLSVLGT